MKNINKCVSKTSFLLLYIFRELFFPKNYFLFRVEVNLCLSGLGMLLAVVDGI